jgi:hypothetical protein
MKIGTYGVLNLYIQRRIRKYTVIITLPLVVLFSSFTLGVVKRFT